MTEEEEILLFTFYSLEPELNFLRSVEREFGGMPHRIERKPLSEKLREILDPKRYPTDKTFQFEVYMKRQDLRANRERLLQSINNLHYLPKTSCTPEAYEIITESH